MLGYVNMSTTLGSVFVQGSSSSHIEVVNFAFFERVNELRHDMEETMVTKETKCHSYSPNGYTSTGMGK